MLSAARAFRQSATSSPEFPRIPSFKDLYEHHGWHPRVGGLTMIAGQPGSMKSMFTQFWIAQMGISCLYFAADSSPFDSSMRLASMTLRESREELEERLARDPNDPVFESALKGSRINYSFGAGLTWDTIEEELAAYVEVYNAHPQILVIDNLMDARGCDSDYTAQMAFMSDTTVFCRQTGIHTVVLHHATDKGFADPRMPPPRAAIKNGLAEKPEQVLTVAIDGDTNTFRVAKVKDRSGKTDSSGETYATLTAIPEISSFSRKG